MIKSSLVLVLTVICLWLPACTPVVAPDTASLHKALELVDQGTLQLRAHDLESAQASFALALQVHPLAAALDGLGCVALRKGELHLAERLFHRAYEMEPDYVTSLRNLALLYEAKGLTAQAEKSYKQALKGEPLDFRARNNLGVLLLTKKDEASAAREFSLAYASHPHNIIETNLSNLRQHYGKYKETE